MNRGGASVTGALAMTWPMTNVARSARIIAGLRSCPAPLGYARNGLLDSVRQHLHADVAEEDAGVGVLAHLELGPELEVLELRVVHRPGVEEVRERAVGEDRAILDREGVLHRRILGRPAVQGFAVEERDEALLVLGGFGG